MNCMRGEEGGGGVCQGALKSQSSVAVKDYREGCERSEHSASTYNIFKTISKSFYLEIVNLHRFMNLKDFWYLKYQAPLITYMQKYIVRKYFGLLKNFVLHV